MDKGKRIVKLYFILFTILTGLLGFGYRYLLYLQFDFSQHAPWPSIVYMAVCLLDVVFSWRIVHYSKLANRVRLKHMFAVLGIVCAIGVFLPLACYFVGKSFPPT